MFRVGAVYVELHVIVGFGADTSRFDLVETEL